MCLHKTKSGDNGDEMLFSLHKWEKHFCHIKLKMLSRPSKMTLSAASHFSVT